MKLNAASSATSGAQVRSQIVTGPRANHGSLSQAQTEPMEEPQTVASENADAARPRTHPEKSMTLTDDNTVLFKFTDASMNYVRPAHRKASLQDPELMGINSSIWHTILSTNMTVREALKYSANGFDTSERISLLENVSKEELMKDIKAAGYYAELLQVQGSSHFTDNEQLAACAAASSTDVFMNDQPGPANQSRHWHL